MASDIKDTPETAGAELPGDLKLIKTLVVVLAGTMILGLITIIGVFVTRFPDLSNMGSPGARLPENIALPEGAEVTAVTFGQGWVAVVTQDNEILIFDSASGTLSQRIGIAP